MINEIGDLRAYLVKILHPESKDINGTGFFCHPDGYVLTCWHVITPYLKQKESRVILICEGKEIEAEICEEKCCEEGDIAALSVSHRSREFPALSLDTHARRGLNDSLQSFGYPIGYFEREGIPITGTLGGLTPTKIDNIEVYAIAGLNMSNVDGGYSGAPLINQRTQKVIGLIYAKHKASQAFFAPIGQLFKFWPEIKEFHDVFQHIRIKIVGTAKQDLEEKLHETNFIPLNLERGQIPTREKGQQEEERERKKEKREREDILFHGRKWEPFDLGQLFPPRDGHILSSNVGAGKTTFLHWLTAEIIKKTDFVPCFVSCGNFEKFSIHKWKDLQKHLISLYANDFLEADLKDFFENHYKHKKLFFLFDGLDQIGSGKYSNLAKTVFDIVGENAAIISSRPSAVLSLEGNPQIDFLRLQTFSEKEIKRYFGEHYPEAKRLSAFAPDLISIPMLAFMVKTLIDAGESTSVSTRTDIYQKFLLHILSKQEPNAPVYREDRSLTRKVEKSLGAISFNSLAQREPRIQKVEEELAYESLIEGLELENLSKFGLVNLIMDKGELPFIYFTHQSFQEFLAAKHVNEHNECFEKVLNEFWNPKWREVIKFLTGLKDDTVVRRILGEKDNSIHYRLFLAAECCSEIRNLDYVIAKIIMNKINSLSKLSPFEEDAVNAAEHIEDLDQLLFFLEDENKRVREAAIEALGALGERLDVETLNRIAEKLNNWPVKEATIKVLRLHGERLDTEILQLIAKRLNDYNGYVREEAIYLLGSQGKRLDAEIFQMIAEHLHVDFDDDVPSAAIKVLMAHGDRLDAETLHMIAGCLYDGNVRWAAIQVLMAHGDRLNAETFRLIVKDLRIADWPAREEMIEMLGTLSERIDVETLHMIARYLGDESEDIRVVALETLRALNERLDTKILHMIAERLRDEYKYVREAAIEALEAQGDRLDAKTLQMIVECLHINNWRTRRAAIESLGALAERLDVKILHMIAERLRDEDKYVRSAATYTLGGLGERLDAKILHMIAECLRDVDGNVRSAAIYTLGGLGERLDAELLHMIAECLRDEDENVRSAAIEVLGGLNECLNNKTLHMIAERLRDDNEYVRRVALKTLGALGETLDVKILHMIAERLRDVDGNVREAAIEALKAQGDRLDAKILHMIAEYLRDVDGNVRKAAIEALKAQGDRLDAKILHMIVECLRDVDGNVREAAIEALKAQGVRLDAKILHMIVECLHINNWRTRRAAIEALGALAERLDAETIYMIAECLRDRDLREAAITALKAQGDRLDAKILHMIAECLRDESEDVRGVTLKTLGALGEILDAKILHMIAERLRDKSEGIRRVALETLRALGERLDAKILHMIAERLRDRDLREAAITALKAQGDRLDEKILHMIAVYLRDEDKYVREAAIDALHAQSERIDAETVHMIGRYLSHYNEHVRYDSYRLLKYLFESGKPLPVRIKKGMMPIVLRKLVWRVGEL